MAGPEFLSCEETFRRLDDYLDRELSPDEMEAVRRHLERCAICAAEYRFDETVLRQVREKIAHVKAPPGLLDAIRQRIASG